MWEISLDFHACMHAAVASQVLIMFLGATGLTIVSIICLELPYPLSDKCHVL
jgi:hypothetical protein